MDKLTAKLGKRPFQLAQFYSLRREWMTIMIDITSGNPFDPKEAVEMIEVMEALASQMDFDVYRMFPELEDKKNQAPDGLPWGNWTGLLRRDLHEELFSLLRDIMRMKEMLFEALKLPELCKPITDCAAVCQYCNWILARCGRGLHDPDAAGQNSTIAKFKYLCAIDYFPDFKNLKTRSIDGCEFCHFLRNALLSPDAIEYRHCNYSGVDKLSTEPFCLWVTWQWNEPSRARDDASNTLRCLTVELWSCTVLFDQDRLDFCVESTDARLASKLSLYQPPQMDALSPSNVAFIQQQLGVPRREVHPSNISGAFLPRRLVDLGVVCASPPRLVDSSDVGHTCKYATLSYCWGPPAEAKQQLKLTYETRDQFYQEIPLETMSPVLRDTFTVCKALHIRYIWIDALCILQGDKTDWEEQSSQMDRIFQHSYITIGTPASSSCMQGFLRRTSENCRPSIRICYVDEISNEVLGAYSLRPTLGIRQNTVSHIHPFVFPKLTAERRDLALSAWAHRGWIFQERFLSTTQIIFGSTMLHILRDGIIMSENGECSSADPLPISGVQGSRLPTMSSILNQGRHIPDCWYDIVEQYCFMEWTEKLDLFPGLSGIAAFFQQAMQDEYLAGLWQKDLYCGLLWHTGTTRSPSPSSLGELLAILNGDGLQIGPSWSWASRSDFFQFDISPRINTTCRVRSHLRPEFDLLGSSISVDGVNPLGRVEKASLKICGLMIRLRAGCLPNAVGWGMKWKYKTSEGHTLSINPDWNCGGDEESNEENVKIGDDGKLRLLMISSCCSDWPTQIGECSSHHPLMEEEEDYDNTVIYKSHNRLTFLEDKGNTPMATADCSLCSEQGRRRDIWGLLVYPAGPKMIFYRVGTFICRAEYGGSDLFNEAERQVLELL